MMPRRSVHVSRRVGAHGLSDEAWAAVRGRLPEAEATARGVPVGAVNSGHRVDDPLVFAPPIIPEGDDP